MNSTRSRPGGIALHYHVEEHNRHVRLAAHELAAFGRRICGQDFQPLPIQLIVAERETGAIVNGGLIINDRDLPAPASGWARLVIVVIDQLDDFVVSHAPCPSLHWVVSAAIRPGATRGMVMRNRVPQPRRDSKVNRPPNCWVTRLNMMCRPRPVPPSLRRVVKNGSSARRWMSSLIPTPSSETKMSTSSSASA